MTYRDDTDAALARADALADDLKRAEQERDQLRAEVEQLKRGREDKPVAIVAVTDDTADLIEEVIEGILKTHNDRWSSIVFGSILAVAGVAIATYGIGIGMFVIGIGVAATLLSMQQYGRDNSELLIETLKMQPELVTSVRIESKGLRLTVGDYSDLCRTHRPTVLAERLQRYCVSAKLLPSGE